MIYETKIATYTKQMDKIKKLLEIKKIKSGIDKTSD